jgi:hypothetical protein
LGKLSTRSTGSLSDLVVDTTGSYNGTVPPHALGLVKSSPAVTGRYCGITPACGCRRGSRRGTGSVGREDRGTQLVHDHLVKRLAELDAKEENLLDWSKTAGYRDKSASASGGYW